MSNLPPSVFRPIKSWLWSEGKVDTSVRRYETHIHPQSCTVSWFTRTYALPVFSQAAHDRWKHKGGATSYVIWDSRHLRGQALRLLQVKTICQMVVDERIAAMDRCINADTQSIVHLLYV